MTRRGKPMPQYTAQFKEEACHLVTQQGYPVSRAAKSLGLPQSTLYRWLHPRGPADQPFANHGEPPARGDVAAPDPAALAIQVRELEAKVRRLEMEKEILKKATAFFATQHP